MAHGAPFETCFGMSAPPTLLHTFRDMHGKPDSPRFKLVLACCNREIADDSNVLMFSVNDLKYPDTIAGSSVWLLPNWDADKKLITYEPDAVDPAKGFGFNFFCPGCANFVGWHYPLSVGYHDKPGLSKLIMKSKNGEPSNFNDVVNIVVSNEERKKLVTPYSPIQDPKKTNTEQMSPKYGFEKREHEFLFFATILLFDQFEWTINNLEVQIDKDKSTKVVYYLIKLLFIAMDMAEPNDLLENFPIWKTENSEVPVFDDAFIPIKASYKSVYSDTHPELPKLKCLVVERITNRICLILKQINKQMKSGNNAATKTKAIKGVQAVIKQALPGFKDYMCVKIYQNLLYIFNVLDNENISSTTPVYDILKEYCADKSDKLHLATVYHACANVPLQVINEIKSADEWISIYNKGFGDIKSKKQLSIKDKDVLRAQLVSTVNFVVTEPYCYNRVMGKNKTKEIKEFDVNMREIIKSMIKAYFNVTNDSARFDMQTEENGVKVMAHLIIYSIKLGLPIKPLCNEQELIKLIQSTPNIFYLESGGAVVMALKCLGYSNWQYLFEHFIYPKVWRVLTFYETPCATINVNLHATYSKLDTSILNDAITYIIKLLKKQTRALINKDANSIKMPIIKWQIICGAGSHSKEATNKEENGIRGNVERILNVKADKKGNIQLEGESADNFKNLLDYDLPKKKPNAKKNNKH